MEHRIAIAAEHRDAALANLIEQWSPFKETNYCAVWSGSSVMLWLWDQAKLSHFLADVFPDVDLVRYLPETLFVGRLNSGYRVIECARGFELQEWKNGILDKSEWVLSLEKGRALKSFFARQNFQDIPVPEVVDFSSVPWVQKLAYSQYWQLYEKPGMLTIALLLCSVMLWQEVRIARVKYDTTVIETKIFSMQAEVAPMLAAKSEFQKIFSQNGLLLRIMQSPNPIALMMEVDKNLPSETAEFVNWRYQNKQLQITIADTQVDPVRYVSRLQDSAQFTNVRVSEGRKKGELDIFLVVE